MNIGLNIKRNRERLGLSQEALAKKIGVSQQAVDRWENAGVIPRNKAVNELMNVFGLSRDALLGDSMPSNKGVKIPVLGRVVAGVPIDAVQEILDYEEITSEMTATGEYFALQVKGASMEPTLHDGDIVIVKKQPTVDSGDIAIVLVNGNDATVKEIQESPAGITLIGHNAAIYTP
ncbi:LexA family transcriptional regulator [uncultured Megasphaera sp.]|jgi:repressor LexA|uniref:LexA family protein n=1 Tax=uncultured Megasphaera sp. TaxID=165188 RepID=UPI0025EF5D7D|nr:S24 family peptidase [uncultured Megasphaera sp.]